MHLPESQVDTRVDRAPFGHRPGPGQQGTGGGVAAAHPRQAAQLLGDGGHLLAGLEKPLGVAPVDVTHVERHQPPGGVEDVDGHGVGAVGVADGVAEHHPGAGGRRQAGHPGGVGGRGRTPARNPVVDQLDEHVGGAEQLAPPVEHRPTEVGALHGDGRADLGRRAEKGQDPPARSVLGDEVQGADRLAPLPGEVGGGDEPTDRSPAGAARGQEGDPRQPEVAEGATARRSARGRP